MAVLLYPARSGIADLQQVHKMAQTATSHSILMPFVDVVVGYLPGARHLGRHLLGKTKTRNYNVSHVLIVCILLGIFCNPMSINCSIN